VDTVKDLTVPWKEQNFLRRLINHEFLKKVNVLWFYFYYSCNVFV
jgi:hypothetical protein